MNWEIKKFDELSVAELYCILQLRNIVFVVEQNCIYPDLDDKDQLSFHLLCWRNEKLIAYSRLIPPGVAYAEPSIGRVVTAPSARKEGIGKTLMKKSIEAVYQLFTHQTIRIGAQLYLKKFYGDLGFVPSGSIYLEDGIEHIEMVKF